MANAQHPAGGLESKDGVRKTPAILLVVLAMVFLSGCVDKYEIKFKVTMERYMAENNVQNYFRTYEAEEAIKVLRCEDPKKIKDGVIVYARYGLWMNSFGTNINKMVVIYLSDKASVRNVRILKRGKVFKNLHYDPFYLMLFEKHKNDGLQYFFETAWSENDDPLNGVDLAECSVELVKADGKVIGPKRIMSNKEVIDKAKGN